MENGAKALLIAAAVLIAIIIVALAVKLLSSANGSADVSQRAGSEVESGTEKGAKIAKDEIIKLTQVNLLNLNRTYESLAVDANIGNKLDETKGYLNIGYKYMKGYNDNISCKVSNSSNSITVTNREGGITVAFPIHLPDNTKPYRISFNYSGNGRVRAYWSYANSSTGFATGGQSIGSSSSEPYTTVGASGTIDITIQPSYNYIADADYLIIMLASDSGADSGKTKTYSNVVVSPVD